MRDSLLHLYHRLPTPARSLAASLHGYSLKWWRYGSDTDRLVEEAIEREHWTVADWEVWHDQQKAALFERAATKVPFYRDYWKRRRALGENTDWSRIEDWPILEKESLRANPLLFLADDCNPKSMYHEHTSGTSGKPVQIWWQRNKLQSWYALWEARIRNWYGVSRFDRWAILGGQLVAPVAQKRPPFWVWNAGLNQLYMSAYHIDAGTIAAYVEAIHQRRIVYLWGYTSSLYSLASGMLQQGIKPPALKVVITNAEPIEAHQRNVINSAFNAPVCETYGMCEAVVAATECPHGRLHLWPSAGIVEVVDGDSNLPPGSIGDLVCTGLINTDFILIRYRVGDRGALSANDSVCGCGRLLPSLVGIEGRCDDVLYTRDGRQIGRLDPVFKASLPVREVQIIQESLDRLRVLYVPTDDFRELHAQAIIHRVRDRMGKIEIELEAREKIPRSANGKFRAVICNLPEVDRKEFRSVKPR